MVLVAVLRLGSDAYGAAIAKEIESCTGRRVASGSLYITLDRLESKGLITSRLAERAPDRAGRPKRFVTVTKTGVAAVRELREAVLRLWNGVEDRLETT
jgi:PadR family transcriptional regulator PadR